MAQSQKREKVPGVSFPNAASRRVGILATKADVERVTWQWVDEDHARLLLLCQHHSIPDGPHMFYQLALALARELYPEPKRSGRKTKCTDLNRARWWWRSSA